MYKRAQQKQSGFTIIEVMIVLAIAGIIMLMLFIAVPALQRNNRNTQMRNDVALVLGLIDEYRSNNNGALPDSVAASGTDGKVTATKGTVTTEIGTIRADVVVNSAATVPTETGTISIALKKGCKPDNTLDDTKTRAVAALFLVEGSSVPAAQCEAS